ncbi:glycosyltransferase family 1 protein [uncultured Bradyrhizobium sp.]|uniref:glycosyltransferase family 4 protein n=1 Tax=uncultured Bradyrhizobium sp. TaxID=199684 RepID=UPI00260F6542|nr:glycosyltransferase family 1 protein [uncultured Bradyrhizobium sp.]
MTGVGNYTFRILDAILQGHPEIDYRGFGVGSWSSLDLNSLRRIAEMDRSSNNGSAGANRPLTQKAGAFFRSKLARLGYAQAIYRKRFSRSVRSQSLDLFHAFNYLPAADPGVVTLPVVYDLSFVRYPDFHPVDRLRALEGLAWVIERAPMVQTISEFSRNEIARFYGYDKERIFVAPPAAASIFRPLGLQVTTSEIARYDITAGNYLLSVGTLEPRKNLRTLVAAYSNVSKSIRDRLPLIVVGGKGWGELDLPQSTAGLVHEGSLRFIGSISNPDLRSLYEGARALLYPSVYEGFGMPVVECMACGTSVIHSSRTSMDEITAGLAPTVDALDVDAWSEQITKLAQSYPSDQRSYRDQLLGRASSFSWSESAEKVLQGYKAIMQRGVQQ